jgi:hypothetical protein
VIAEGVHGAAVGQVHRADEDDVVRERIARRPRLEHASDVQPLTAYDGIAGEPFHPPQLGLRAALIEERRVWRPVGVQPRRGHLADRQDLPAGERSDE